MISKHSGRGIFVPIRPECHGVETVGKNLAREMLLRRLEAGDKLHYLSDDTIVMEERGGDDSDWPRQHGFSGSAEEMSALIDTLINYGNAGDELRDGQFVNEQTVRHALSRQAERASVTL